MAGFSSKRWRFTAAGVDRLSKYDVGCNFYCKKKRKKDHTSYFQYLIVLNSTLLYQQYFIVLTVRFTAPIVPYRTNTTLSYY